MPHYRRLCAAAVLMSCLVSWARVETPAPRLHERKEGIVRNALARWPEAAPSAAVLARIDNAEAITAVELGGDANGPALTIGVTGRPQCRVFSLDHGRRVVLDIQNTINLSAGVGLAPVESGLLRAVRTSLYALQPDFVSRVVLDLTTPGSFRVKRASDRLTVSLHAADAQSETVVVLFNQDAGATGASGIGVQNREIDTLIRQITEIRDEPVSPPIVRSAYLDGPGEPLDRGIEQLAAELKAVADFHIARSVVQPLADAAVDQAAPEEAASGASTESATAPETPEPSADAEAPDKTATAPETPAAPDTEPAVEQPAPEAEPEPPAKREQDREETLKSNSALVGRMRDIIRRIGSESAAPEQAGPPLAQGYEPAPIPIPLPRPGEAAQLPEPPKRKEYHGDPLQQPVDVDFRDTDLVDVVALLAHKAGINVIAGSEVSGTVTANLHEVPLLQAMQTVLRMNDLGVVEEEGIYRIVPYEDAVRAERVTMLVTLENGKAAEVRKVLADIIKGMPNERLFSLSANETSNTVVIAGPKSKIGELVDMARRLDVAEPVLPTITECLKLNYAEPAAMAEMVEKMLTPKVGTVASDPRARHLVVTDAPVVVEQVRQLVAQLDVAVKQVVIETMIVDVVLGDDAETGVDWLLKSVKHQNTRRAAMGPDARATGSLQNLSLGSNLSIGDAAGLLSYGLLTNDIDWTGVVQAEIRNRNGRLVSNPVMVTVENKPAKISISQEIPYVELSQTSQGGSQTSTQFKDVGTILTVTPAVTHDNHIIVDLDGKESLNSGEFNGIPIEDKRQMSSTLHMRSGQTIFVGGLRKHDHSKTVKKLPVLGDIPVLNFAFRSNNYKSQVNELIVFLTCSVLQDELPSLTPYQQIKYDEAAGAPLKVDAQRSVFHDMVHTGEMRDPAWKWRRTK